MKRKKRRRKLKLRSLRMMSNRLLKKRGKIAMKRLLLKESRSEPMMVIQRSAATQSKTCEMIKSKINFCQVSLL